MTSANSFADSRHSVKKMGAFPDPGQGHDDSAIWQKATPSPGDLSPLLRPLEPEFFKLNPAGHWAKWIFFLYVGSFFLPAWVEGNHSLYGYGAFALGLLGCCLTGGGLVMEFVQGKLPDWTSHDAALVVGVVAWLANPVLWIGLVRLAKDNCRSAVVHGFAAFLLGLGFLIFAQNSHLQASWGYYGWMASMVFLAAAGWWGTVPHRRWRS